MSSTIAAIATPLGKGAVSIIRLSGDKALDIASKVFSTKKLANFKDAIPNTMYFGKFNAENFYDMCLAVYFKAPHSFTGEDTVEFQCHGGIRLTEEVLKVLLQNGATIASKGEFTKRAFLNGKYSLAEAEGIIDMINSENLASLNASSRLMSGYLSEKVNAINKKILDITASLEASLDYPDELEEEVKADLFDKLNSLQISIKNILRTAKLGRIIKNGINVAIIGEPNIGKSSLLNCILGKDRAIVTDIAGTTRDTLEERVEINGVFVNFIDTAGIRDTSDIVEKIGVDKAHSSAKNCDIMIILLPAYRSMNDTERELLDKYKDKDIIKVYNKSDLGVLPHCSDGIVISCQNKENIEYLLKVITEKFTKGDIDFSGEVLTNYRHIEALERALDSMKSATKASFDYAPTECILIDLRICYRALGEISGETCDEDIIDRIFSKFCLGK